MFITYQKLKECGILLEGTLSKPSITITGVDFPKKPTPADVAAAEASVGSSNNKNVIAIIHYNNKKTNKCRIQLLLEPPFRHSCRTLMINNMIVIIMPSYYNQQPLILNVKMIKD